MSHSLELDRLSIVLVQPTHPGNIGATARAMKTMGLHQLTLVAPSCFPHHDATARASGADDVLARARVVDTLPEAIAHCHWVIATSARQRHLAWPSLTPETCAHAALDRIIRQESVAIVFGPEHSGLDNAALGLCQQQVIIPTAPEFSSLNLAAAVQILTYEIYKQAQSRHTHNDLSTFNGLSTLPIRDMATREEIAGLMAHLRDVMISTRFLNMHQPKRLLQRLLRIIHRAALDKTEVNIIRGFLSAVARHGSFSPAGKE